MQLSTPVGSETMPLLELIADIRRIAIPHAAQAVRPGRLKSSVFSAVVDSEEPLGVYLGKAAALIEGEDFRREVYARPEENVTLWVIECSS
jgi:hypothetical protein